MIVFSIVFILRLGSQVQWIWSGWIRPLFLTYKRTVRILCCCKLFACYIGSRKSNVTAFPRIYCLAPSLCSFSTSPFQTSPIVVCVLWRWDSRAANNTEFQNQNVTLDSSFTWVYAALSFLNVERRSIMANSTVFTQCLEGKTRCSSEQLHTLHRGDHPYCTLTLPLLSFGACTAL